MQYKVTVETSERDFNLFWQKKQVRTFLVDLAKCRKLGPRKCLER
jgi:hypothetical protein